MRDGLAISIVYFIFLLGAMSIIFSFLSNYEPKPKSITDIKEVIINGEVYRKVEK